MSNCRVAIQTVALALTVAPALAVDYYVSSATGNDAFDGRSKLVSAKQGPFASLKPVESLQLRHGDRVLLRCGERFAGPLKLTINSPDGGELSFGSYGDCTPANKPRIDGRVPLAPLGTGRLQQFAEATAVEQVFAGETPLPRARFPSSGYLILSDRATPGTASLSPYLSLVGRPTQGARLHARTEEWFIEERAVLTADGQLDKALQYPLRPKNGFYLTGKSWMIGDQQSWAYDAGERQLYLRSTPDTALSKVLSGPLLQVSGRGSITIAGIDFDAAGGDAISTRIDGAVSIKDVNVRRAVGNGIAIAGARNAFILNCTISDVGLDAIFFAETKRVFIRRNRITNAGLYAGPRPSLAAVNAHRTDSATIDENMVENSAYIGIRFSGDARIRNNYVSKSCMLLSDCAAIYTWRRNAQDRKPRAEVVGNLIDGANGDTAVKFWRTDFFAGIYLDEFSNNVLVANNVIVDVNQGIYLHNAFDNDVRNNIVRARLTTLLEAVDKDKLATLANTTNILQSNSERLGSYAISLFDANGRKKEFSFDEEIRVELEPSRSKPSSPHENRTCKPDPALLPTGADKTRSAFASVVNCE